MFGKPTIPEYGLDEIQAMLKRCRQDPALMKFTSTILVAAGYWYKRANLYLMMQPIYFVFGFVACYFLMGTK
jgi:hypothetical protein